jgi:hypothetical protein
MITSVLPSQLQRADFGKEFYSRMRTQTIGASSLSEFAVPVCQSTVIAGLVPATPIKWHGRASLSGVAGSSPAMTIQ